MSHPKPYIWINAFPGVGKLTTARLLHNLIPNSVLIDNHTLIDVVTLPRDHPDYNAQRVKVRQEAFAKWAHPTGEGSAETLQRVLIFTDFYTTSELGTAWATEHKVAAEKGGRLFLPVYLRCEREENLRRLTSEGRVKGGKWTDAEAVGKFRDKLEIMTFEGIGLDIDVTSLSAEETAARILQYIQDEEAKLR